MNGTGYGPRTRNGRLPLDGDERKYEKWEIKFLGYMQLQKLKDNITAAKDTEIDAAKNEEVFMELIQFLDDKSLALIMRDAQDDGSKALKILKSPLRWYRQAQSDFIVHGTDFVSEVGTRDSDYVIRAKTLATAFRNASETLTNSLLISMVLKAHYSERETTDIQGIQGKVALQSFKDIERPNIATGNHSVMKTEH